MAPDAASQWIDALLDRHMQLMSRAQFLKAVRALSARYVEGRAQLSGRSPTDSAGKRAAFAAFYSALHFLTTREVVRAIGVPSPAIETIVDLGGGTGVAGGAWALEHAKPPFLRCIDRDGWALSEARWNFTTLGLRGRTERRDLVRELEEIARKPDPSTGLVFGWSLNELPALSRARAIDLVVEVGRTGAPILIIEPIARRAAPWWADFCRVARTAGARCDEWKFDARLPARLAHLDEAAGFRREHLAARSVTFNPDSYFIAR